MYLTSRQMCFWKKLWMNLERRATSALSVLIHVIVNWKGVKSTIGEFMSKLTDISLCVFLNTIKISIWTNGEWHTELAYNTLIRIMHYTIFYELFTWSIMLFRATHPPKSKFCISQWQKSCLKLVPQNVLANSSLNKYTMWQKFKDQKKVFKKLKLVHTQVEKTKAGASFTWWCTLIWQKSSKAWWQPERLGRDILPLK